MMGVRLLTLATLGCYLTGIFPQVNDYYRYHRRHYSPRYAPNRNAIINTTLLEQRELAYKDARRNARVKVLSAETRKGTVNGYRFIAPENEERMIEEFSDIENAIYNLDVEDENLIEGDIRENPLPVKPIFIEDGARVKRKIENEVTSMRWPDKHVPWRIGSGQYSDEEYVLEKVRLAVHEWASKSCVTFSEIPATSTPSGPFIEIVNDSGCWSFVGMRGTAGAQRLSLRMSSRSAGCVFHGVIMHEFGHALGFTHEQSRPDRDKYADILFANIYPSKLGNFNKKSFGSYTVDERIPYDASSLMHYGLTGFTRNKARTITLKNPELNSLAGQRVVISWYDEVAMNLAYNCAESCQNNCENDGYVRRFGNTCRCICPPYISGLRCENVSPACGAVHALRSEQTTTILSRNYPKNYLHEECAYLFTAPPGHSMKIEFHTFELPAGARNCKHTLDIRKNLIGQASGELLCGQGAPAFMTTAASIEKSKLLVVFDATDESETTQGKYSFTVTSVRDPCLSDPCHGAPCSKDEAGGYICDFLDEAVHCGFETGFVGPCSVMIPNHYYDDTSMLGRAWDMFTSTGTSRGAERAAEGNYFLAARSEWNPDGNQVGTISIVPHKIGGRKWCLDFKYAVYGSQVGYLNIYKAVNGVKGQPIFTEQGTASQRWVRRQQIIDGTDKIAADMIEVVFEAVHETRYSNKGEIGLDDIKFTPGECPTGSCANYPCGTHRCVSSGSSYRCIHPSKNVSCSFEAAEDDCHTLLDMNVLGDRMDFLVNTGTTLTGSTGPDGAHTGRRYAYIESSSGAWRDNAYLRIRPFVGEKRHFSLWYSGFGNNMGSLRLYKSVNGRYPGTLLNTVFSGNQGELWKYFETIIDNTDLTERDTVELTLEAIRGSGSTSDLALDDISYELMPATFTATKTTTSTTQASTTTTTMKAPTTTTTKAPTTTTVATVTTSHAPPTTTTKASTTTTSTAAATATTTRTPTRTTTKAPTTTTTTSATTTTTKTPTDKRQVCIGFESGNITEFGVNERNGKGSQFSIHNHISSSAISGTRVGLTGANWALEGRSYLYFKANYPHSRKGDKTRYRLNSIQGDTGVCVSLNYIMSGVDWRGGKFNVYAEHEGRSTRLLAKRGNQGEQWQMASFSVTPKVGNVSIVLEVIRGRNRVLQDLAVDKISITSGECGTVQDTCFTSTYSGDAACSFEPNDDCSWLSRDAPWSDDSWYVGSDTTNGFPSAGVATGYQSRYYGLFKAGRVSRNQYATLVVKPFTGSSERCLRFFYAMNGNNVQTLEVFTSDQPNNSLLFVRGNQGGGYKLAEITIPTNNNTEVYFEATRNRRNKADIVIDNLIYTQGPC